MEDLRVQCRCTWRIYGTAVSVSCYCICNLTFFDERRRGGRSWGRYTGACCLALSCVSSSGGTDLRRTIYMMMAMLSMPCLHAALVLPAQPHVGRRSAVFGAAAATVWQLAPAPAEAATGVAKEWTLANGVKMPTLALNTAGLSADDSERAFTEAVAVGFTHVDFHPGIERDGVARALKSGGVDRAKVFLNTKIRKPPVGTSPSDAAKLVFSQLDEDLAVLGVPQVDMLMLRDSPDPAVMQAQWAAMEEVLASKRARSIGVINYCQSSLECILATAKTKPALNYIMQHVGMGKDTNGLRAFGESRGIKTFAYGALGEPGPSDELLNSPTLKQIGSKHGRSVEEVALRYGLQSGCAVSIRPTVGFGLGKSTCSDDGSCRAGLRARASAFDWSLTAAEMAELSALTSPAGNPTLFSTTACPDSFFATMQAKK